MNRDELIEEIERNPYDAQQTMLETFALWADGCRTIAETMDFRRDVADSIAAYDDAIEAP